jgi:hypothetical protein
MNGDSYSSRGMASTSTKPSTRVEAATNPTAITDGRHSSSRDHYVRFHKCAACFAFGRFETNESISRHDLTATTDVTVTATETETGIVVAPAPRATVGGTAPRSFVGKARSTPTRQAATIGNENVKTAILAVNGVMIGRGIGIEGHQEERLDEMTTALPVGIGTYSKIGNVPE